MSDNYIRLNYTEERELSDYVYSEIHLLSEEVKLLIESKKAEVIAPLNTVPTTIIGQRYYYNLYENIPAWFLDYVYYNAITMVDVGFIKLFLDDPIYGVHWARELMVGVMEAYKIRDLEEDFKNLPDGTVVEPKALSRTVGSQSIGDMAQTFESERLSMKLEGGFQQFLSTLPNGIDIITEIQGYKKIMPRCGAV